MREDAIRLFGFDSEVERSWFRTLQTVQGVGAKVALALLGTLSPQDLANAIALADWASVEEAPGIGKKLAQRIVAELKDKAPALSVAGLNLPAGAALGHDVAAARERRRRGDVGADQPRLSAGAGFERDRHRHERAGRGRRDGEAHPPRPQGAGAVGARAAATNRSPRRFALTTNR